MKLSLKLKTFANKGKIKVLESLAKVLARKSKLLPRPLLEVTRQGVEV